MVTTRKRDEASEEFDYDEAYRQLIEDIQGLHILRIDEMPRIELYKDQLLNIVTDELTPLYGEDEKIVTGSMVNNYVKQHVVPAPVRKRYNRRHLASLLLVCVIKRVLPIAQVTELLRLCIEADVDVEAAYDSLVGALEETLAQRFTHLSSDKPHEDGRPSVRLRRCDGQLVEGTLPSLLESVLGLVANRVYVEKLLALEARRGEATPQA